MTWIWVGAFLAGAAAQEAEAGRIDKARARLLEMVVQARAEKQDAEQARSKAEENLKKAEQVLALARRNADDEASKKAVEETIPKMVTDARCLVDRASSASRAAEARIRLTERALANLKSAPPSGPFAAVIRKLGARASRQCDEEFARSHGFVSDPAAEKRLGDLVGRLSSFAPYGGERPGLKIVKGKYGGLAAFATTDTIYVLEDELKRSPSEEDLLVLLGHELAHVQLGHYAAFYAHYFKEDALQRLQGTGASDADVAEALKADAVAARTSDYSVRQELEADVLGAQMSIAAGAAPEKILKELEAQAAYRARAEAEKPGAQRSYERLVRTHPEPEERLKKLREVLGATAGPR